MKKLIFLLFFIPAICSGQAIYISFQPADLGFGLRGDYDMKINKTVIPLYGSFTYGNWGLYKNFDLKHHIKTTIGIQTLATDFGGISLRFGAGLNYHHIFNHENTTIKLNSIILKPVSFEINCVVYIKHFALGMRIDILRWEPCLDLGYCFKSYKRIENESK